MSKNRISGNNHTKAQMNHYSNQHNPNNNAYKSNNDNHSNQLIQIMIYIENKVFNFFIILFQIFKT